MKGEKIISWIIITIFFIVFSFFYGEEYINFHKEKIEIATAEENFQKDLENFEIEDIKEIKNIDIIETPNKELLEELVNIIDSAEDYLYIEVYMFTETRLREATVKAYNRWVDVKVILEKDPYLAYNINNTPFEELEKKWISIVRSNQNNYGFNHAKIILVDWLSIISTWNFTYSTFTQNRDLFVFTQDKNIHKNLLEIFETDFSGIKKWVSYENLVLSPQNSRNKITKLLEKAENEIKIYIPYFSDEEIVEKIINLKKEKDLEIIAIIPKTAVEDENTIKLIRNWIKIYEIPKYKLHSKAILVDEKYLFIWSVNFSEYSFDKNREIGILTKEEKIISKFIDIFENDLIQ